MRLAIYAVLREGRLVRLEALGAAEVRAPEVHRTLPVVAVPLIEFTSSCMLELKAQVRVALFLGGCVEVCGRI